MKKNKTLTQVPIFELTDFDQANVPLVRLCRDLLVAAKFKLFVFPEGRGVGRLLNLLQWEASDAVAFVDGEGPFADQVVHDAIHYVIEQQLGSKDPWSMLFAETVASAADFYLVGKLIAAGAETDFLVDTVESLGSYFHQYSDEARLEAWLETIAEDPFAAFVSVARFLFDATKPLIYLSDPGEAGQTLLQWQDDLRYPVLHHYNIANWVLTIRARFPKETGSTSDLEAARMRFFENEAGFLGQFRQASPCT